ncbi:hypothetical protein [Paenibacillus oleatilyticus]|uniref:Uncharacterized protein n=1 Tax=Paenibacillus oleatilyticus TaxID=2594886 RepID=A0ABV4VB32_9BACL
MAYKPKTNWQFDETVTENDLNRIEKGIKDVYEASLTKFPPVPVSLKPGPQVIESDVAAPLTGLQIKGRTLVNLLGRDGNCEDLSVWGAFQVSQALDSNNKSIGNNAIKLTISTGFTSGSTSTVGARAFSFKAGKYYVAVTDIKNGTAINGNFYINGTTAAKGQHIITATDKFYPAWRAYNPAADVSGLSMVLGINGEAGQYAYFDGVRIYEITQSDYNTLDTMTPEQVAAKWPYVDDMKSVYSPYVIKYGENLLPPFTEWITGAKSATYNIIDPYKASITTTIANDNAYFIITKIPVVPNTTYTLNVTLSGGIMYYYENDNDGARISLPTRAGTFITSTNTRYIEVVIKNVNNPADSTQNIGTVTISNPMLNLGPDALLFQPRNDDHLFFPNVNLASNVDGTYDTLFQRDGKYWKQARYRTMELDGKLEWRVGATKYTGFRQVLVPISNGVSGSGTVIKYDGKVLAAGNTNAAADIQALSVDGNLYLSIAAADSGWGDSYTNVTDDEIKAYFYGWKMKQFGQVDAVPYTNGTKEWVSILQPVGSETTTLPTTFAPGYKPYKLQYQLAAATVEEIASEGGITLHEGANQITVGTGMIVRDGIKTVYDGSVHHINNIGSPALSVSRFLYRALKILEIYEDGKQLKKAVIKMEANAYGIENAHIAGVDFNNAAAYTVTYLALDQYALSCNLLSLEAAHPANMKSVVDTLAAGHADMTARVGALEVTRAQRAQPQWVAPTLMSGWQNADYGGDYQVRYVKDDMGFVHILGLMKGGAIGNPNAPAFILPPGYRPPGVLTIPTLSFDGTKEIPCRVWVRPDGTVVPASGSSALWFTMCLTPFYGAL